MLRSYLQKPIFFTVFASFAAFSTYLCFYPFRRAYTAATYDDIQFLGIAYKIWLITAQILGFACSKGLGVKYVSEMLPQNRPKNLLIMVLISWLCYLFFAFIPPPYNLVFMFLASLPLGWVYGIVLGFLEGRKVTDLLVAVLTGSFIIGSGFSKSLGKWVMQELHIDQFLMPAVVSALMLIPFGLSVWLLSKIPPPNATDQNVRSQRQTMNKTDRKTFLSDFSFGMFLFIAGYVLLTTFREFRDNFTPEIWRSLGNTDTQIFTKTEIPIAITVILLMASLRWVQNNYKAFLLIQWISIGGGVLIALSTFLYQQQLLSPFWWLTLCGMGAYLAYSLSNGLYSERLIATFKQNGTIGFLITLADYYAYLGSISVLFYKNFFKADLNYVDFLVYLSYAISFLYVLMMLLAMRYYKNKVMSVLSSEITIYQDIE